MRDRAHYDAYVLALTRSGESLPPCADLGLRRVTPINLTLSNPSTHQHRLGTYAKELIGEDGVAPTLLVVPAVDG